MVRVAVMVRRRLLPVARRDAAAHRLPPALHGGHPEVHGKPGAAGAGDPLFPGLGNGGYDVSSYLLDLDYDPKTRRLSGTAEIHARATQDLSSFHLDLHGLTVDGVTLDGKPAEVEQHGDEVTVHLPKHVAERGPIRALVRYSGTPRTIVDADAEGSEEGWLPTADGALAVGEPAGSTAWFPGNHHPSDKASYGIKITVPSGVEAVSNGVLHGVDTTSEPGRTTYSWKSTDPMPSYAATLAVGDYVIEHSAVPGSGQPVVTAVNPAVAGRSRKVLAQIPEVLSWSAKKFGRYPFEAFGDRRARGGDRLRAGDPDPARLPHRGVRRADPRP